MTGHMSAASSCMQIMWKSEVSIMTTSAINVQDVQVIYHRTDDWNIKDRKLM